MVEQLILAALFQDQLSSCEAIVDLRANDIGQEAFGVLVTLSCNTTLIQQNINHNHVPTHLPSRMNRYLNATR
jgi:hypothetical protein